MEKGLIFSQWTSAAADEYVGAKRVFSASWLDESAPVPFLGVELIPARGTYHLAHFCSCLSFKTGFSTSTILVLSF